MAFGEAQREVDEWISRFEEGYFKPLTLLARATEELGELARELNHAYGEKPKKPEEAEGSVSDEICDVIFVLISMANSLHIDLDAAFKQTMDKYRTRDANRWTPTGNPG